MIPALKMPSLCDTALCIANTFINSPKVLLSDFRAESGPIFFRRTAYRGGRIYGIGRLGNYGRHKSFKRLSGENTVTLPADTMIGALSRYISDRNLSDFSAYRASFGLLPPFETHIRDKRDGIPPLQKDRCCK